MNEGLSRSLTRYVREIDIIILGLGILLFVSGEHSPFSQKLFDSKQFIFIIFINAIYFVSLYFFLTYDWIAYNTLISKYPYKVGTRLRSLGRLYTDLFQLFIKALLICLATLEIDAWHLFLAASLFTLWHLTILVWHGFARAEYPDFPVMGWRFRWFAIPFAVYAALLIYCWAPANWAMGDLPRCGWAILLCATIVAMSWRRQRNILAMQPPQTTGGSLALAEFDEHVASLRSVLEANAAAQGRVNVLEGQLRDTQASVADIKRDLATRPPDNPRQQ